MKTVKSNSMPPPYIPTLAQIHDQIRCELLQKLNGEVIPPKKKIKISIKDQLDLLILCIKSDERAKAIILRELRRKLN
jgi:hypothetical protein